MNILVIPTTDWLRHPVPNRLNFIFDEIGRKHNVYVLGFNYAKYSANPPRNTKCTVIDAGTCKYDNIAMWYIEKATAHRELIEKTVKSEKIDVIVSANILPSYFAAKTGKPTVYDYLDVMHLAASEYIANPIVKEVVEKTVYEIVKRNIESAKKVITVTYGLRNYIVESILGKNYKKYKDIHVVPNGVDIEKFRPNPSITQKNAIIYTGSLEGWVDLETPIRACKEHNIDLYIVGTGLHTEYASNLMKLGGDNVFFTGLVPYEKLPDYINSCKIGLNPLRRSLHNVHSAGGKIFNYLACGIPMLSTPWCSPPYPPINCAYWFYNNEQQFVEFANSLFQIELDRWNLHNMARDYDWKKLARKYEDVIIEAATKS